jgi:hypothetical protein
MEHTISTKDLKGKLDRNESIKVVETLAPEVLPNKNAEIVTYCTNTHPMKEDVKKKRFSPPLRKMRVW